MIDSFTKRPFRVSIDDTGEPFVAVLEGQLQDMKDVLNYADIRFELDEYAIQSDAATMHVFRLRRADPALVQSVLDRAAVRVCIRHADNSMRTYFESQDFIDRYYAAIRSGCEGNELVHELFSDDWGAPPTSISLEGQHANGTTFRASLPYESRSKRRR
jgi:hypothetical protein